MAWTLSWCTGSICCPLARTRSIYRFTVSRVTPGARALISPDRTRARNRSAPPVRLPNMALSAALSAGDIAGSPPAVAAARAARPPPMSALPPANIALPRPTSNKGSA
jgi:hypothetical protein